MDNKPLECPEGTHTWMEIANATELPLVLRTKDGGTSNASTKLQIWKCKRCFVVRTFSIS